MNRLGNIIAVSSPKYNGSRGRVDVFQVDEDGGGWKAIGDPIVGDLVGDELGTGMHLSADGNMIAVGLPGNNAGKVQVYTLHHDTGLEQIGQTVVGSAPLSQFGYSLALSGDGSRLFVGAPQFGEDPNAVYGMVQVYDFDGTAWVQVGKDLDGDIPGGRFGSSISADDSGSEIVVGAPLLDIAVDEDAGEIRIFTFEDENWSEFVGSGGELNGHFFFASPSLQMLGSHVAMHCKMREFASGGRDYYVSSSSSVGTVRFWSYVDDTDLDIFPGDIYPYSAVSGSQEGVRLGYDIDMNCDDATKIWIASGENQGDRAGIALVGDNSEWVIGSTTVSGEFPGPELGDTAWFGKGPSVAMSGLGHRLAIGYESIRVNGTSRSAIHIYDFIAL
jgi:hypothetical protein